MELHSRFMLVEISRLFIRTLNVFFFALVMMCLPKINEEVLGDFLEIRDGSTINGSITKILDRKIFVHTHFAGDIEIKQDHVVGLEINRDMHIQLLDGRKFYGAVGAESSPGYLTVKNDIYKIDISSITKIQEDDFVEDAGVYNSSISVGNKSRWQYEASVNIAGRTGNAETFATSGKLSTTLLDSKNRVKFYMSVDQAEDNGNETSNEFKLGTDFEAGFPEKHSGFFRAEAEQDEIEGVDLRLTTVAGYGYYFLKNEDRQLRYRIGVEFRHENFVDNGQENKPGIELGVYHFYKFNESIRWTTDITHSQSTNNLDDYRTIHESSLEFPLGKSNRWKMSCGVLNEYNNRPAENVEQFDTKYFANFVLNWEQPHLIYIEIR